MYHVCLCGCVAPAAPCCKCVHVLVCLMSKCVSENIVCHYAAAAACFSLLLPGACLSGARVAREIPAPLSSAASPARTPRAHLGHTSHLLSAARTHEPRLPPSRARRDPPRGAARTESSGIPAPPRAAPSDGQPLSCSTQQQISSFPQSDASLPPAQSSSNSGCGSLCRAARTMRRPC